MKKIVALALVLLSLIPCAFAESIDYSSMTADQLREVIVQARAALASMEEPFMDKCVVYDANDIKITITGIRKNSSMNWVYFDITVINKSENNITVHFSDTYVNGWKVSDDHTYISGLDSNKNAHGDIHFTAIEKEAEITEIDQIEDFSFKIQIRNADTFGLLYETDEQTIIFSW